MNVYVAAPYADGAFVREAVHPTLRARGISPTSTWAELVTGPEDFSRFSPEALRGLADVNDRDVAAADVVLLLARAGVGAESFAEVRFALELGKAVVWSGRLALSAWRRGVVRVADLDEALGVIETMRDRHVEGYRGPMLAHLAGLT